MSSNSQNINNEKCNITVQHNYGVVKGNVYNIQQIQQHLEQIDSVDGPGIQFDISIPITSFHGRSKELKYINELFTQQKSNGVNVTYKMVAICGLPGIGKTECARQYVSKYCSKYQNSIWINAETNNDIENSFRGLAIKLNMSTNCHRQDIYNYISKGTSLFVFDNIENMRILKKFLPATQTDICFLLTTQNKNWGTITSIELNNLTTEEAVNVLQNVLEDQTEKIGSACLIRLAKSLDCFPLTLQIGANYILQQIKSDEFLAEQNTIEQYISAVESNKILVLIEELPDFSTNEYTYSAYKAICFTLEKIKQNSDAKSQLAFTILSILSYLNSDYIKYSHLLEIIQIKNNEQLLKESLVILIKYSFIRIEKYRYLFQTYKKITIHRLIQECLRYHHTQNKTDQYYKMVLKILLQEEKDFYTTIHYESILKHAEEYFELFYYFYTTKKSERLYKLLIQYGRETLITKLIDKLDLNIDALFFCICVKMDQINLVHLLLEHGADPNKKLENGRTVLHFARSEECISSLISKGALVNIRDNEGETPLYYAFRHRPWNIVKCLIQNGADINLCYEDNRTLLHILPSMITFSNRELIKEKVCFLLKYGAKIDVKDKFGITPIQEALHKKVHFLAELMISQTEM